MEQQRPVALVTGATSGIGIDVAKRLVEDGFTVAISGRNAERGEQVAAQLGAHGRFIQADLTAAGEPQRLVQETAGELGRLDVLVCGFMSHSSVSSTVRAMKDFGYRCTLVAGACATRDLPSAAGRIEAAQVHRLEMAVLADNFATLVEDSQAILRSRGT